MPENLKIWELLKYFLLKINENRFSNPSLNLFWSIITCSRQCVNDFTRTTWMKLYLQKLAQANQCFEVTGGNFLSSAGSLIDFLILLHTVKLHSITKQRKISFKVFLLIKPEVCNNNYSKFQSFPFLGEKCHVKSTDEAATHGRNSRPSFFLRWRTYC